MLRTQPSILPNLRKTIIRVQFLNPNTSLDLPVAYAPNACSLLHVNLLLKILLPCEPITQVGLNILVGLNQINKNIAELNGNKADDSQNIECPPKSNYLKCGLKTQEASREKAMPAQPPKPIY
ncbi:unnamed protein product [Prunus armeniaca]|uniref:Uncharacterized protein n=1 Tax=Prunus armeniaca TaxID=36596 RepID=A0A6J5XRH4_PRUAR|nr:unnamed protein product [Prunus armeniaca]